MSVPNAQLELLRQKQQEATQKAMQENAAKHEETKKVEERTFYSRISGSTYIFQNGQVAQFPNGEYVTNRQAEIDELEALCKHPGNHTICLERVPIQNISDAIIPRDVTSGGQRSGQVSHTGLTSSQTLNQIAAQ